MYTQPTHLPVPDRLAASRYCWQGDVYYDSQDYADFPLRNDAADTPLSAAAYQASRVPLSEDGRRCLEGLFSALLGYQQSRLLQALASSHFLGLPIQVATLAQGLYTAVMEGQHRSTFLLSSLTLTCQHLLRDSHPLFLLADELRQILRHWLGDALAESLFGQNLPQTSVSASLLGLSCCAAALYLCRDPATPAAEPQRLCLRLPRCLVTLLHKGQLYWDLLNVLADRAAPSGPTPRQLGVQAQQRHAGSALYRQRPARFCWDKALAKRLEAPCPVTPQHKVITAMSRSRGVKAVNVLHPTVMMPALLAIGTGASSWPKKIAGATTRVAVAISAYHVWHAYLAGVAAAPAPHALIPQQPSLAGRNTRALPFSFDHYDRDVMTHREHGNLLRPFIEEHVPTDFYPLFFNSLLNRAITRPAIVQCQNCSYGLFVSEIYRQTVEEINFIQTLHFTRTIPLPHFLLTLYNIYRAMRQEWHRFIDNQFVASREVFPFEKDYEPQSIQFSALRRRAESLLSSLDVALMKQQLLTLLFFNGQERGGKIIIPLEFCRQIYPELEMALQINGEVTRSVLHYLTEILYQELFTFQDAVFAQEKNIIDYRFTNPTDMFLTFNNNDSQGPQSRTLLVMLVYKRLLPALEYLKTNGKQGLPSLPWWALEHLINALIQGEGPWPARVKFPAIAPGKQNENETSWPPTLATDAPTGQTAPPRRGTTRRTAPTKARSTPTLQDYTLAGLTLSGLAALATIYGFKASFSGTTPSIVIFGGSASGLSFGAITAHCTNDMGVAGIAAFGAGFASGRVMGDRATISIGESMRSKRAARAQRPAARALSRAQAAVYGDKLCPILLSPNQDSIAGRHPYHYVQQWLEPAADKVLYFGKQQQIADAEFDYFNEAVKLSHHYFQRVIAVIETLTEELIAHRPALRQRVRKYLQGMLENSDSDSDSDIIDHAECQFIGYCQQALQFLDDTRAVNFTNIVVIATRQRDDRAPCLLGNSKSLPSVYGAQHHSLRGMVFIADALLCHPDRWRQIPKTGLFTRSVEDVLRATLQISSVLNNFIPLTQDSLTLLPDQPTANAIMTYRLNTLGQDSDLHAFLTTYAARHNLRLSSNLTEALTQHKALKADIVMNNIDHITMMVREMFLQINPSSP